MSIWAVGAYARDMYVESTQYPREGESINADSFIWSDGGKAANQAVMAARLGAHVNFVGALGNDAAGDHALALLSEDGVHMDAVQRVNGATGASVILHASTGEQSVITWPGAADQIDAAQVITQIRTSPGPHWVSLQGELPTKTNSEIARALHGHATIVCNPSPIEPFLEPDWDWGLVDVLIVNELEASEFLGSPAEAVDRFPELLRRKLDVETVAVSLGRAGIVGTSPDDDFFHVVPPHVEPVDTTGAGDAAAGAFLAGLSKGWPFRQANALATLAATYSVTRMYCIPSYPTVDELHAWEEATSETHVTAEFRTLP